MEPNETDKALLSEIRRLTSEEKRVGLKYNETLGSEQSEVWQNLQELRFARKAIEAVLRRIGKGELIK